MAEAIMPKRRHVTEQGNIIEIVAWSVPKSKSYPEGTKYSFAFICNNIRTIAFDNFNNEGHHKHYIGKKEICLFKSLEDTANEFFRLVDDYEKSIKGDKS